jgi:hypothetical protein
MSAGQLLFRFLLGGAMVSVFAAVGSAFKPKTFAGLFASAPPIALVSLGLAFHQEGVWHASLLGRSMVLGSLALLAYCLSCVVLVQRRPLPVVVSALLSWLCWGLVAATLFWSVES